MLHGKIDLNLFLVLSMIYEEGSITAAANRLCLTQPAVSHALSRLRNKFDDPLFVRKGKKMHPTELCINIMPNVASAIKALELTLDHSPTFDITQHHRTFQLGFRDILEALVFPDLMHLIAEKTSKIAINSQQVRQSNMANRLAKGELDVVIDTLFPIEGQIQNQKLCDEHFVLVCGNQHPIISAPTLDNYLRYRHVIASLRHSEVSLVDTALTQHQKRRNVALRCENFYAAIRVVSEGEFIMTMPNAYARQLQQHMPISLLPLPFEVPPLPVYMYWSETIESDPFNDWLRAQLLTVCQKVFPKI